MNRIKKIEVQLDRNAIPAILTTPMLGRKGPDLHSAGRHTCGDGKGVIIAIGDQGYEECTLCGAWSSERSLKRHNVADRRPGRYAASGFFNYPGTRALKRA